MSLCCCGGIPSFSSTLSLIRSTFIHTLKKKNIQSKHRVASEHVWVFLSVSFISHLVCGLNVDLYFFSGESLKQG